MRNLLIKSISWIPRFVDGTMKSNGIGAMFASGKPLAIYAAICIILGPFVFLLPVYFVCRAAPQKDTNFDLYPQN